MKKHCTLHDMPMCILCTISYKLQFGNIYTFVFMLIHTGNKCYKLIGARRTADRRNYTSARDTCRLYGAGYDIASVTNHLEQGKLITLKTNMFCLFDWMNFKSHWHF
jgi:hypothetical protein